MPLIIPSFEHEIFKRNSLTSVICQIKVQPIFRIASETPALFQEKIRHIYPIVNREEAVEVEVRGKDFMPRNLGNTWRFLSEDNLWQVTLESGFLAFETKAYTSFTDFKNKFEFVHEQYCKTYAPSRPERIGLRYTNKIRPINVRTFSDWTKWIKPEFIGLLAHKDYVTEPIINDFKVIETLQPPGFVGLRHGLMSDQERTFHYLIDIDRYIMGAKNQEEIAMYMKKFNEDCYNLFRTTVGDNCYKWMRGEI